MLFRIMLSFSRTSTQNIGNSDVSNQTSLVPYLLFINGVRGLYCKIQSPWSAVQPELARAVLGD